jgi:hypothetical protein
MKEIKALASLLEIVDRATRIQNRKADQRRKNRQLEISERRLEIANERHAASQAAEN